MTFKHYTESLPYEMLVASRVIHEAVNKFFEENNLPLSHDEFVILDTIYCHPNILQIDLAKLILKGRAHTGRFLMSLEEKKFIERTPNRKKGRLIFLNNLTQKGEEIYQETRDKIEKNVKAMNSKIPCEKLDELIETLTLIRESVQENYNIKFN